MSVFLWINLKSQDPVDTGRKLNVHKTFRRRPGRPLNVLCTFNLRPASTGELTSSLWYCYIDVVLFIWTHGKENLASFLNDLNNFYPNIKLTNESNKKRMPFLELNVKLSGNKLSTDLYIKSTDRHQ